MGQLTMITGGARSGKSTYAEILAKESNKKIAYVATSIPFDEGMKHRIQKHREQRPKDWYTIEEYREFHKVKELEEYQKSEFLLVDCITVMITNLMFYSGIDFDICTMEDVDMVENQIFNDVKQLISLAEEKDMIVVTNELGMGLVPAFKFGNYFRDIAGRMNQYIASQSHNVYFVVSGIPMKLK